MVRTCMFGWMLGSVSLLCGCGPMDDGPLTGGVTLENNPFLKLPRARAQLEGSGVTITTLISATTDASDGFESLATGSEYHAWARSGGADTHLGSFTPGVDLTSAEAVGADQILVSIEDGTPGGAPSSTIVLSGAVDGELVFGALDAVAFSGARAEAFMGADWVELEYDGLPALPSGYGYQLWVMAKDENNEPEGDPIDAGALDTPPTGRIEHYQDEHLPEMFDLFVTIEASAGAPDMSGSTCLKLEHDHAAHAH